MNRTSKTPAGRKGVAGAWTGGGVDGPGGHADLVLKVAAGCAAGRCFITLGGIFAPGRALWVRAPSTCPGRIQHPTPRFWRAGDWHPRTSGGTLLRGGGTAFWYHSHPSPPLAAADFICRIPAYACRTCFLAAGR